MKYQSVFQRYELKYLLNRRQAERIRQVMAAYMRPDSYGRTTVRNIYFDTENFRLIRRSMEKPLYKEKLRLRSYELAQPGSPVFVELKKKFDGVVYKRRLVMPEQKAMAWLCRQETCGPDSQIGREIDYFRDYYGPLTPAMFLSYDREAFCSLDGSDFRVTFDRHILCRSGNLSLEEEPWGTSILEEDQVLMELKTAGSIPLWMAGALSEMGLYKTSFSKYGAAYERLIFPCRKGGYLHV